MKNIDYLLLTTYDALGNRLEELLRLLNSIQRAKNVDELIIRHYVLLQRTSVIPEDLKVFCSDTHFFICVDRQLSLSRARNLMINQARNDNAFAKANICAFPDDDAWYPNGVLKSFLSMFNTNNDMDIAVCKYSSAPITAMDNSKFIETFAVAQGCFPYLKRVSSNTLFLRAKLAESTGYFDERLGVGAAINGGEDTDYALRAFRAANGKVMFSDIDYIGHRDRMPALYPKYFAGGLYAIARSGSSSACLFIQMLRRICIGAYLVITRKMLLTKYIQDLKIGISGFGEKNVNVEPFS